METVLTIKNLTFGYTKERLLYKNFNLTLHKGEVISIVGPSGIGKSTLFELIAGFLKPMGGEIEVERFSFVFQDPYNSFHPSFSIFDQIKEVADIRNLHHYAKEMDIESELLHKPPHELSGGQLQRCSILRALLMEPKLILADEPTSALDNITQLKVMKLLLKMLDRVGILLITHDIDLARWCSDKIVELSGEKLSS